MSDSILFTASFLGSAARDPENMDKIDQVHSDLWDANIIRRGHSMMLVEFDWDGKVGAAYHPTLELSPELLEGRVSRPENNKEDDKS